MNKGGQRVIDMNPSVEAITKAIDNDLKEWTLSFGKSTFEDMKEDLNRHYKTYRSTPYTQLLWGEMLRADEDALLMASKYQLAKCDDIKQMHWGKDKKKLMDENGDLMQLIYSSCRTDTLFDLSNVENIEEFLDSLISENLSIFYEIIVRRTLIQCEMFPELKKKHEAWLKGDRYREVEGGTSLEVGIRRSLERLMQERIMVKKRGKELEEPLFNLQNHWQGVYRILVDKKYSMDADFEGFNSFIVNAMPQTVNKPYKKESVKQISKTDFNIPFAKWKYNGETSGNRKVYDRMYAVAHRFKELLEEEGL